MKRAFVVWTAAVILSAALITGCEVEEYNAPIALNPPLALSAWCVAEIVTNTNSVVSTNNYIGISFKGFNDESYFSGYAVYVADNVADLTNGTNSFRMIPSATSNAVTLIRDPVTTPTSYEYQIKYDTNYLPLTDGKAYYIEVEAYSVTHDAFSLPSNPTNVTFVQI